MTYLIGEILLCLIITAVSFGVIGWYAARLGATSREKALRAQHRTEVERLAQESDRFQALAAQTERRLSARERHLQRCESRIASLNVDLDHLRDAAADATANLDRLYQERVGLTQQLGEKELSEKDMQSSVMEAGERARAVEAQLANWRERARALEKRVHLLAEELHIREQTIAELEKIVEELEAEPEEPVLPPARLLMRPIGEPDDLQRIRGIGEALANTLNDAGIFHFYQLASMREDEDLEWLAHKVHASIGRIRREAWVDQARSLIAPETSP